MAKKASEHSKQVELISFEKRPHVERAKKRRRPRRLARNHAPDSLWIETSKTDAASLSANASVPSLCTSGWRMRRANRLVAVTCRICLGKLCDMTQYANFLKAAGWHIP